MPTSERTNTTAKSGGSRISSKTTQSGILRSKTASTNTKYSYIPPPVSTSLCELPSMNAPPFARERAEQLKKWKARSLPLSDYDHKNRSLREESGQQLPRQTKTSRLRSKTCPVSLAKQDYDALNQKRKLFDRRCRALSASMSVRSLTSGETLHSFLVGARYNSGFTLDTRSLESHGVHIPKKNRTMLFVNRASKKPPSAKIFGSKEADSHSVLEIFPERVFSVPELSRTDNSQSLIESEIFEPDIDDEESMAKSIACSAHNDHLEQDSKESADGSVAMSTPTPVLMSHDTAASSQVSNAEGSASALESSIEEAASHSSVSLSEATTEENEQDFISHKAQELAREILKECHTSSTSSLSSQGNRTLVTNECSQTDTTQSNNEKVVIDKSLQTSFKHLSINEDSSKEIEEMNKRSVSAGPGAFWDRCSVEVQARPHSAKALYARDRTTIIVDMTDLQSIESVDS